MMASGKLSSSPKINPLAHRGSGSRAAPITNPMANRFRNAPIKAAVLSAKVSGSIDAADKVPYTRPQIVPRSSRDIVNSLQVRTRIVRAVGLVRLFYRIWSDWNRRMNTWLQTLYCPQGFGPVSTHYQAVDGQLLTWTKQYVPVFPNSQ